MLFLIIFKRKNMKKYKFGFTLAEIMIALTVIGIITSILLPVAFQSTPNEDVMKFKKGNATLAKIINELASSEKYYKAGDLGTKADGTRLTGTKSGVETGTDATIKYFCQSVAELVNAKSINCSNIAGDTTNPYVCLSSDKGTCSPQKTLAQAKALFDSTCKTENALKVGEEIKFADDIIFYQASPQTTFGLYWAANTRLFSPSDATTITYHDEFGFDAIYKVVCLDVDGINKGEDPFGYGIRADGKLITGARADTWLAKDIQDKD